MRSSTFALSLLASLAIAQPHRQGHQHAKLHEVRDAAPAIKWVTEWEYTTEVIPVTKTVWVSEGFVAPSSAPETTSTSTPSASATKGATVPAQFFQPASEPVSSSTTLSTVVSVAPPVSTSSAQPTTTSVAPPPPPPVVKVPETTTTTPPPAPVSVYTPPPPEPTTTTQAPAPIVAAPIIAAPIAPVVSSVPVVKPSSGSAAGPCSEGSNCNGDITYYEAGLGACGWTTDGETDDVIALSHLMMGTQSNGNPFCGKTVTIKLGNKSITAKVVDKCMGCEMHAIDLSNHAFKQLADFGVGRTKAEWYFN